MKKVFTILMAAFLLIGVVACNKTTEAPTTDAPTSNQTTTTAVNALPTLAGVTAAQVYVGDTFDPMYGITATDAEDGSLTASIVQTGTVDLDTAGDYTLTYTVTDSNGGEATATRVVSVLALTMVSPTGVYNFKFESSELRNTFMAAAEKYMMDTMYGGVPMFANGGFAVYSSRLQLPVDEYVAVMGYGTSFATMTADDSTVLMDDGELGEVGEYTYRTTISTNPGTWNQWLYDTSTDSDLMGLYYDALYTYQFNSDKTGYEVVPSMAATDPSPVDSRVTETGKTVSNTWQITLRDDLEWYYHEDTDTSALATGHATLDANDFVDTFKLALDEQWFRAISGGGDFITSSNAIKNAQAYVDGDKDWADVGIKLIDDLTFEFTFVDEQSNWNVRYFLSSFVMTPINTELYDELGDSYGTSNTTIAYHGPFYVDYFEADKVLKYKENPNYHNPNEYFYTGYTFSVIEDSAVNFQEFVAGKLDSAGVPTEYYDSYKNYPGIKQIPGSTTFRMMINGAGDVATQTELFPTSVYVPEPILANLDFTKAMFFAIDRQKLAEEVLKTSTTMMYYFSDAYLVDAENGVPYRLTPQGISVGEGLSPSTFGYNRDAAEALFNSALDTLVADGVYEEGTQSDYTVIELDLYIFSGSVAQSLFGDYVKSAFESTFVSYDHNIKIQVNVEAKDFPGIYYDYMMTGDFDLSIGGISGSTLDAASFLDVFCEDNRGGFTLNWGIDTSTADIEVLYETIDGVKHLETWSYDAITSALNGNIYIVDGEEAVVPYALIDDMTPYGATFTIQEFTNPDYEDLTYNVQIWNTVSEAYDDLPGFVNLPAATAEITVTGLESYYDGNTPDGYLYQGDYRIKINYTVVDSQEVGYSNSDWFATDYLTGDIGYCVYVYNNYAAHPEYLGYAGVVNSPTAVYIDLELNGFDVDTIGTYASLKVYDGTGADVTADVTVDDADMAAISITGLDVDSTYFVEIILSDDTSEYFELATTAIASYTDVDAETDPSVSMLASYTLKGLTLSDADGITRTLSSAQVLDSAMEVATGAAINIADVAAIEVTGLMSNTAYYVEFTYDTAEVETAMIMTLDPLHFNELAADVTPETDWETTVDSITLNLVLTNDGVTTLTVSDVNVYVELTGAEATSATVDFTDISAVSITDLEEFTRYIVEVEFSDGSVVELVIDTDLADYAE